MPQNIPSPIHRITMTSFPQINSVTACSSEKCAFGNQSVLLEDVMVLGRDYGPVLILALNLYIGLPLATLSSALDMSHQYA